MSCILLQSRLVEATYRIEIIKFVQLFCYFDKMRQNFRPPFRCVRLENLLGYPIRDMIKLLSEGRNMRSHLELLLLLFVRETARMNDILLLMKCFKV